MTESSKLKMDDKYITQNDTVQRYLHNKLTPEETVEFEEYMLDKPELLERLELDTAMQCALPQVKISVKEINPAESRTNLGWLIRVIQSPMLAWSFCGLFASFMLLDLNNVNLNDYGTTSPDIVYFEIARSNRSAQKVAIQNTQSPQIFAFEIGAKQNISYDLEILNSITGTVTKSYSSTPNNEGLLVLLFEPALSPGEYIIKAKESESNEFNEYFHLTIN